MNVTAFDIAQRFVGVKEVPGKLANPTILAMLKLDDPWPEDDATPWCSAFVNYVAWLLRLPRSKSLAARSWLTVGTVVTNAGIGNDVVVLSRGDDPKAGHVGFYAGRNADKIAILGGNQGDAVTVQEFNSSRLLGIRRLA